MKTFISYSHQDESWFKQLKIHIAPLLRNGDISIWSDHEILAGQLLNSKINENMALAELFLLLLSPAYLASDYCMDVELKHALARKKSDDVKIVPIIVEACNWQSMSKLKDLKIIPKDAKPISKFDDKNSAFVEIVEEIERIVTSELEEKKNVKSVGKFTSPVLADVTRNGNKQNFLIDLHPQEMVKQLERGKKDFSGIRVKNLELINYDLKNIDFSGSDLSGAKLEGTNLSGANLVNAEFNNAYLFATNLSGANLMNASLEDAVLTGANLECANLLQTSLKNSFVDLAELSGANLVNANLEMADISASNLVCTNLWDANLINSDLERSNFDNANLVYSKLIGANLSNSYLKFANLMQADLSDADLENANFSFSNLTQANLEGANLVNAIFVGAIN